VFRQADDALPCEPERLLQMGIEIQILGEPVWRSVETLAQRAEIVPLLDLLDAAPEGWMRDALWRHVATSDRLHQQLGREPTTEEIAGELECEVREVRDVMRLAQQPISLEKPMGEEDDSALADFVEDVTAESPFEIASEALRRENITRVLAQLPRREREVLELRYGIIGGRARTLEEVGRAFNITRERVRQIENRTLKKLQTLPEAQQLREAS